MATRKTRSQAAPEPTRRDVDTPVSLHPTPFEEAVMDRPKKREKSA